jgi:hypothetical protein
VYTRRSVDDDTGDLTGVIRGSGGIVNDPTTTSDRRVEDDEF